MKTIELRDSIESIKKGYNFESKVRPDCIGNPNWLLWLKNAWENSNLDSGCDSHVKEIFSYLSGNPNYILSAMNNDNYANALYVQINSLLTSKFIDAFTKHKSYEDYSVNFLDETIDSENGNNQISQIINIRNIHIEEILDAVKNESRYFKVIIV